MTVFSASLADPTGTSALVAAARWMEAALLGSVATTMAVIAVAGVGFLMLTGRFHLRRGTTVLMGCFLLFGAPTIVGGLRGGVDDVDTGRAILPSVTSPRLSPSVSLPPIPPPPAAPYDPYAGAAVPTNR